MSEQESPEKSNKAELSIEKSFPIERVNEIAEKEARGIAKQYYRPIYTMHKWWARRLGCVFRTICLYSLLDGSNAAEIKEPGADSTLSDVGTNNIQQRIDKLNASNPEALWDLYSKDVTIDDKKVLDPFMGGGTSVVESSRFGADVTGYDLNPVAWFITKKEIDASKVDIEDLKAKFNNLKENIALDIKKYYKTKCPNNERHEADVMTFFWVKELECTSCARTVPLFDDYRIAKGRYGNSDQYNVICPECDNVFYTTNWRDENSCDGCGYKFNPSKGNTTSGGSKYSCSECGQKYGITDAIQEQDGYNARLIALEYYCPVCDEQGLTNEKVKGYKGVEEFDQQKFSEAKSEWERKRDLRKYIPQQAIREGHMVSERNPVFDHGYSDWIDMWNERQLLSLSKLLKGIDEIEDKNIREFFLLAFTDSLRGNTMMVNYQIGGNAITNLFKSNSFDPPKRPAENNPWGADEGARNFIKSFDRLIKGIEYAKHPFDRYKQDDEMVKSPPFDTPVGENTAVYQGDSKDLDHQDEFDAVITDPPYYQNIIYSELSDYFYIWQRILLEDEYECFEPEYTPREESIVANPALGKGPKEFEEELKIAFENIHTALKDEGILIFTYHHSESESWGELLEALCEVGFEISASYPITADLDRLEKGESVSFDIIVVAKPSNERTQISWNSLRRTIYRTARSTRQKLEEDRELSRGDIGVIEMGECFREYSKHHGKVVRDGEVMSAKEVVDEIYGVIQEASSIGTIDVFLDLLEEDDPSYDDVNKLSRGTNATPEELKDMKLFSTSGGFELGTWDNEERMAYIQERVNGDDSGLTALDKAQFLRYQFEHGKSIQNYLDKWGVDEELRELVEGLADATGDDTYLRVLGNRDLSTY